MWYIFSKVNFLSTFADQPKMYTRCIKNTMYVTVDILKLIFDFFSRYSCAPVALFSAPVTKYVGENYLPIKV